MQARTMTMPGIRRWFLLLPLLLSLAGVNGCATSETRQFARELNPAIGKADKAYFVEKYGEPDKRTAVDLTTDVWEYHFGGERLNEHASRGNLATSTLLRLTFTSGTLSSWQASNALR
jgi:hypothetical protein